MNLIKMKQTKTNPVNIENLDGMLEKGMRFYKPKISTPTKVLIGIFIAVCLITPYTNWLMLLVVPAVFGTRIDRELISKYWRKLRR